MATRFSSRAFPSRKTTTAPASPSNPATPPSSRPHRPSCTSPAAPSSKPRPAEGKELREYQPARLVGRRCRMPATTPEQICQLFKQYMAEGDVDALLSLYDPEAVFLNSSGEIKQGRQGLRGEL